MSSRPGAAPTACSSACSSGVLPLAPSSAESAPPALVPLEMMRSVSPGITASWWRRKRTAAFRSTSAAGALPVQVPSAACSVRPRAPGEATTSPRVSATAIAEGGCVWPDAGGGPRRPSGVPGLAGM